MMIKTRNLMGEQFGFRQRALGYRVENRCPQPVRRGGGEFLEKIGKCFLHARRILDFYSRHLQSQNGKTHRHAMVVVGFDLRAVQFRRINRERIAFFDDFRAAFGEFGSQGDDAFAFLDAEAGEIRKSQKRLTHADVCSFMRRNDDRLGTATVTGPGLSTSTPKTRINISATFERGRIAWCCWSW